VNRRAFVMVLNALSTPGEGGKRLLDPVKIRAAGGATLNPLVHELARRRQPIALNLIHPSFPFETLSSLGYLHQEQGVRFAFLCTGDQIGTIRRQVALAAQVQGPPPIPFIPTPGRLSGFYPGEGQYGNGSGWAWERISYNDEAKAHFRRDTLQYLKALGIALGWTPMVSTRTTHAPSFNAGGVAVSGDASASFAAQGETRGVYVTINASGLAVPLIPASRSGVTMLWRFNTVQAPYSGGHNRWVPWNLSADELAQEIRVAWRNAYGMLPDGTRQDDPELSGSPDDHDHTPPARPAPHRFGVRP
jgi:hypothetical protein